jgi:hypothetical protein
MSLLWTAVIVVVADVLAIGVMRLIHSPPCDADGNPS